MEKIFILNLPPLAGEVPERSEGAGGGMEAQGNNTFKGNYMKKYRKSETEILSKYKKQLRKNMTFEEVLLWQKIRNKQLSDFKIRRQVVIGQYIVDFVCLSQKLIIEIDGSQHFEPEAQKYDEQRTAYFKTLGFRVLRFTNAEIKKGLDEVLDCIYVHLQT
ncbi:endonuclease domain-containing protein [Glaesserella parasuis]